MMGQSILLNPHILDLWTGHHTKYNDIETLKEILRIKKDISIHLYFKSFYIFVIQYK